MRPWVKWTIVVIVIASMLALSILPWYLWAKPDVNTESQQKAQQLHDLAVESGMNVPDVDTLEQIYGTDGGYAAQVAQGYLQEAALVYTSASTGEVLIRPSLAQAKHLGYSMLVMKVYQPDFYWDNVLPFVRDLNVQNEEDFPEWLKEDLAQVQ